MAASDLRKTAAARVLAQGGNQSKAAEAAGVARSTSFRWFATEEFKQLILEEREKLDREENPETLESLVSLAHKQLKDSLTGTSSVSASQAKIALDVLKAAESQARSSEVLGKSSLAARLEELDDRGTSD
jgi:transposase-like protein